LVEAFFATDRDATGASEPGKYYGGKRGALSFGTMDVSIPRDHRMGELESPSMLRLQFRENPNRHVTLRHLEALAAEAFIKEVRSRIARSSTREALIFVHGYSVSFEDGGRRVAQLAYDLNFDGIPLLYSWPSEGAVVRYAVDENNVRWTVPHFAEFLRLTLAGIGARLVHVIAHGLGTRCLAETLHTFDPTTLDADAAALGQVIFAAPDIDTRTFEELARGFRTRATRFTLYASSNDRVLKTAKAVAGYPRAGDAGPDLVIVDGIDTIDATSVDTNLVGHSYLGGGQVLSDIFSLLRGLPPDQRFGLVPREKGGRRYYAFSSAGSDAV
jgi:esterase/lipase superfamily enzyme